MYGLLVQSLILIPLNEYMKSYIYTIKKRFISFFYFYQSNAFISQMRQMRLSVK
jgi:hypothetical protein